MAVFAGIDVGSRNVRVVRVKAVFGRIEVEGADVIPIALDPSGAASPEGLRVALGEAAALTAEVDARFVSLPGERISTRFVEVPAAAARKLAEAIGFELEGAIPFELDAAVLDFQTLPTPPPPANIRVIACAVPTARIEEFLKTLKGGGIEPREIAADPLVYAELGPSLQPALEAFGPGRAVAIVDVGHTRTNVLVLRGERIEFCRTIARGGKSVTDAIAQSLAVPFADAEREKENRAVVPRPAGPPPPPTRDGKIAAAALAAVDPLAKELKRTFAAARTQMGDVAQEAASSPGAAIAQDRPDGSDEIAGVYLCGAGALLRGLPEYLAGELGVPVDPLPVPAAFGARGVLGDGPDSLKALAIALRGTARGKRVNLRKGALAFVGESAISRKRLLRVAAGAFAVLLSYGFSSYARYVRLSSEHDSLDVSLRRLSREVLGQETTDVAKIRQLVAGRGHGEEDPTPPADAFDVLDQMSRRIPSTIVHDVEDLDVRADHVQMRALANNPSDIDTIVLALRAYECFQTVEAGKRTRNVGDNRQKYSLDIAFRCPGQQGAEETPPGGHRPSKRPEPEHL